MDEYDFSLRVQKLNAENERLRKELDTVNSKFGELAILAHNLLESLYYGRTAPKQHKQIIFAALGLVENVKARE